MKINIKIISVMIIIMLIGVPCFGTSEIDPETFSPTYKTNIDSLEEGGEKILGYIVNIAAISSVLILAFLGLKFMVGSVEQKAEYKKSFMPLIVGMFLVLGSSMLVDMFWNSFIHSCPPECLCYGGTCEFCGKTYERFGHRYIDGYCSRCGNRQSK